MMGEDVPNGTRIQICSYPCKKKKDREREKAYENLSEMKNYCKMQVVNIANN